MAISTIISSIESHVKRFEEQDLSILWSDSGPNIQKWNNLDSEDIKELVDETIDLLSSTVDQELLKEVGYNHLNAINNNLNNFNNQLQLVAGVQPSQLRNQHHNLLNQLNAVNSTIRTCGLYAIIKLGPDIPEKDRLLQEQLNNINEKKADIDKYAAQIRTLMSPAVADRLSTAFSKRKKQIFYQKIGWLILLIISVALAYFSTNSISAEISQLISEESDSNSSNNIQIGIIWIIRLLILFPIYFVVFFSIRQYIKERKFEEVYAHKSAISETLPSYPELLTKKEIGDNITSDAAAVIFAPAESDEERVSKRRNYKIDDLKELLELSRKLSGLANKAD